MSQITNEQRVKELIKHFGMTNTMVRPHADIKSASFSKCMNGKRTFTNAELRGIADFMGISLDRLKMNDTVDMIKEIGKLVHNRTNDEHMLNLSKKYEEIALGSYEKAHASHCVGVSLLFMGDYENAEIYLENALNDCVKYNYSGLAQNVFLNILLCLYKQKDFKSIKKIINNCYDNEIFSSYTDKGIMETYRGICAKNFEKYDEAKSHYMNAMNFYKKAGKKEFMGRAIENIASIEKLQGNVKRAKTLFERAIKLMENDAPSVLAVAKKAYAEVLDMLGDNKEANSVISSAMSEYAKSTEQDAEVRNELNFTKAQVTNDIDKALSVFKATKNQSFMAKIANFLTNCYAKNNNYEALAPFVSFVGNHLYKTTN